MNTKKYLIASLAAGIWIFFYGYLANAVVLADFWAAHTPAGLMRGEGQEIMWAIVLSCLLQGLALGYIFTRGYEGKGVSEGIRFGLLVAWFVAAVYLLFYALQPLAFVASAVSMVTDGIMYVGAGVVLASLYSR